MVISVAAITSLTRLQIEPFEPSVGLLDPLTELSALEALLVSTWGSLALRSMSFELLPHGMSQLTELVVLNDVSFTGFQQLVAPLGCLVSLHLNSRRNGCTVGTLLEAPLQGLRHLSLRLGEGRQSEFSALCSALTGLESLSIDIRHASGRELFQHLPQLTCLTSLWIEVTAQNVQRVPGTFLTGLTGLAELQLCKVLSKHNPPADIACLALLTTLQCLSVKWKGSEKCWKRGEPPEVQPKHLQPLSALRWLEVLNLNEAWRTPTGRGKKPDEVVTALCVSPECSQYVQNQQMREILSLRTPNVVSAGIFYLIRTTILLRPLPA